MHDVLSKVPYVFPSTDVRGAVFIGSGWQRRVTAEAARNLAAQLVKAAEKAEALAAAGGPDIVAVRKRNGSVYLIEGADITERTEDAVRCSAYTVLRSPGAVAPLGRSACAGRFSTENYNLTEIPR